MYKNSKGEQQYTLKEKIAYHKQCANKGVDANGQKLTQTQRVNHALAANRSTRKLNKYMKTYNYLNEGK